MPRAVLMNTAGARVFDDHRALLGAVDCASIAVPMHAHAEVARELLSDLVPRGRFDVVGDFVGPFGLAGISRVLGLELDGLPLQGVTGLVGDSYSGWPLQGAEVWVHETGHVAYSAPGGSYRILLGPGTYTLTAGYPLFDEETRTVQVVSGEFATLNFSLDPICPGCPIPMSTGDLPEVTAAPQ